MNSDATPTRTGQVLSRGRLTIAIALVAGLFATPAAAQGVGRDYFEDKPNGYKFKFPEDWAAVPLTPELRGSGLAGRFKGESMSINIDNFAGSWEPDLYVYVLPKVAPESGEKATGLRGRVQKESVLLTVEDRIESLRWLADFDRENPSVDERKKLGKLNAWHRVWDVGFRSQTGSIPMKLDVWTFSLSDRDASLVFTMMDQRFAKWKRTFGKVAKTFVEIEREAAATLDSDSNYAARLRYHEEAASQIAGWRVLPTESQRFIVMTSSENREFVDDVIDRLERSRDLYERDFPPGKPIDEISVVRVCGTREEFDNYGGTSGGVVGWFNPRTKELVLYDASDIDRKMSFAVMTHEAFHQYCHLMFDESEAHRWFDEGHGDYYGAFKFRGKKAEVSTRMPSGLDRLSVLRNLLRTGEWVPIKEHINYDHPQWQSKGVASYAQSWSIVFMLRQGMLGEVNRRAWKKPYGRIIPDYMATLHEGFQKEYAAQLSIAEAEAKENGTELDLDSVEFVIDRASKNKIWKAAIEASWGKIDLDQFEDDWLLFCEKYLD